MAEETPAPATAPLEAADDAAAGRNGDSTGSGLRYRPYLDGLRAIAVYLVVLFHAGSEPFSGGYIGVDVFFVLSGFLVTRLLLQDLIGRRSVRFARFYARRYRRLLPAAFVALVVTALVFRGVASPLELTNAAGSFRAAFLYVTNWYFIHQSAGYFGTDLSSNPVLQFWSLAVEEQFYLVWPLLLGGLFFVTRRLEGRRRWRVMQFSVAAGIVVSLALAWSLRHSDPNRAYYGTDARAYQLLAGALLALTPGIANRLAGRRFTRWVALGGIVALVAVATSWVDLGPIERGTVVALVTVVLLAALESARGGLAVGALSLDPMVYLGKISYGTYLWHWPVIIVMVRTFDPDPVTTIALTALVATALASLSYQILESPIRFNPRLNGHARAVIAVGLATSVIAAVVIVPFLTDPTSATPAGQTFAATGFTPVPQLDWKAIGAEPVFHTCENQPVQNCILVHGTGPHVLLIGDSNAAMYIPTFEALARADNLTFSASVKGGCPWQRNLKITDVAISGQTGIPQKCESAREDTYKRVIPQLNPDIIVGVNLGYEKPAQLVQYLGPNGEAIDSSSPALQTWLRKVTNDSLDQLQAGGRKVVIIEPMPVTGGFNPLDCLSKADVVEQCRFVDKSGVSALEHYYRNLATTRKNVWSVDLDHAVCPYLPICDPIVNHIVVRMDQAHLSNEFAQSLEPVLQDYFVQNGIIKGTR